ncbi:MAG TPA: hypothetical protein ENG78_02620 [Acidiferrobacteraceae bacterium]|nr:hypothetical protein [Acidiferrobacteraceae bacterium]HEX19702.1 hypothetical protein [Acidiferrobacteraceae bacterium]
MKERFHETILKFWSEEEKIALMKIIHDIYVSDNEFSDEERNDYRQMLNKLNINEVDVDNIGIENAVTARRLG